MSFEFVQDLALAVGLGLLVGLQREWRSERPAGIRTFALITLLGFLSGLAAQHHGAWVLVGAIVALAALLWLGNWLGERDSDNRDQGITTEVAALVMFLAGVILADDRVQAAVVITGVTAALLHWKAPLHAFTRRIDEGEFRAIIQFVLIALVLLPIVPDRTFGPFDVLNPFKIWLMVALIVGINLVSYLIHRSMSSSRGALLAGAVGGMISSTATTVSHARQSRGLEVPAESVSVVIVVASAIVNLRILIEIGVVGPALLAHALLPFSIMALFMAGCCFYLLRRGGRAETTAIRHENPAQVRTALSFGVLFAVVILVVAAVKTRFGPEAVYLVALISGLTDVDAITLSVADLFQTGRLEAADAWRVVLVASLSNLLFKAGITAVYGRREVAVQVAVLFGLTAALGLVLVLWWPDLALPLSGRSP